MCLLALFFLAFSAAAGCVTLMQARRNQRSRLWGLLACLPLLGWLPAILFQALKPRGGCRKCGLHLEPGPLHCPRCGWELRLDPNPERPLRGREFHIPGWLGTGLLALFHLGLAAALGGMFLFRWERWKAWEYRVVQASLPTSGRSLDLSDSHILEKREIRLGGAVACPPAVLAPGQATLARLASDPALKAALGGPVEFPAAPQLSPQGQGRWDLEAPVQGPLGRGLVQGRLVLANQFMAFPRLELRLEGASRLLQEKAEPAPWKLPAQVWATLRDYPTESLDDLIPALLIMLLFGGLLAWALHRKKRLGDELPSVPEAPAAVLGRLSPAQREAILQELGRGRTGGLRALALLQEAQPQLTLLEAEFALAELGKTRRWKWWP